LNLQMLFLIRAMAHTCERLTYDVSERRAEDDAFANVLALALVSKTSHGPVG